MGHAKILSRLERLDQLIGLLQSNDFNTASSLADQLAVSSRTLMRDLDVLKDKGYPIETDQGRGGGIRLNRHWGIGRLTLNYREVIDLLLSLAIMERMGSPIFLENLKAIRHKISTSFPPEQRAKVQAIRKRLFVGNIASDAVLQNYPKAVKAPTDAIYEAFFDMKKIHIHYSDEKNIKTQRLIEPHYLFLNWPAWYVLAWDYLREDVRCFRLDRMYKAAINNESFTLKKTDLFVDSMGGVTHSI